MAPKALRWKRLESRYKAHKQCVTDLMAILKHHNVEFTCVNRSDLDRQHLFDIDLGKKKKTDELYYFSL